MAVALKWVLLLLIFVAGVGLLLSGLGAEVPLLKYAGAEAYGVPGGIAVMLAGVLLAVFWRVSATTTVTTTTTTTRKGGGAGGSTTKWERWETWKRKVKFRRPPDDS